MKRELFCQVLRIYLCNLQVTIINCGVQGEYKDKILRYINHILYEDKIGIHLYFIVHSLSLLDRMEQLFYLSNRNKVSFFFHKAELALNLSLQGLLEERQLNNQLAKELLITVTELDKLHTTTQYKPYHAQFLIIVSYKTVVISLKEFLSFNIRRSPVKAVYRSIWKFQQLYTDITNLYFNRYIVEFIKEISSKECYNIKLRKIRKKLQSTLRLFWQLWNTIITEYRLYYNNKYKNNRRLSNKAFKNCGIYILWKSCVFLMEPWKYIVKCRFYSQNTDILDRITLKRFKTLHLPFSDLRKRK